MATRPVFVVKNDALYVETVNVEFQWYAGFSTAQAQRSIRALHDSAAVQGYAPLLEISSKSYQPLGADLSAFNLMSTALDGSCMSVECAFQGSKVFESGGPYQDLLLSLAVKRNGMSDCALQGRWWGFDTSIWHFLLNQRRPSTIGCI